MEPSTKTTFWDNAGQLFLNLGQDVGTPALAKVLGVPNPNAQTVAPEAPAPEPAKNGVSQNMLILAALGIIALILVLRK